MWETAGPQEELMSNPTAERERSAVERSGLIKASRRAAEEALFDTVLLRVDRETYARFVGLFDRPPAAE